MKYLFLLKIILLLITSEVFSQDVSWLTRYGGPVMMGAESLTLDNAGNIYVTGRFRNASNIGPYNLAATGDDDIFLAKFDRNGQPIWALSEGGTNQDLPFSVVTDSHCNIYITGFYNQNLIIGDTSFNVPENDQVFLAKYDSAGNFQWARHGGSYNQNWSKTVITDLSDNIYISGNIGADATFEDTTLLGSYCFFISKYNENGDLIYAKSGDGYSDINDICIDKSNNLYITGNYSGVFSIDTITVDNNSYYQNFFIARLDSLGSAQWMYNGNAPRYSSGTFICTDENEDLIFTLSFQDTIIFEGNQYISSGNSDLIFGKISKSGNLIWHKHIGGLNMWKESSLTTDDSNKIYLAYSFYQDEFIEGTLYTAQDEDIVVAKFDENGTLNWIIQGSGIDQDYATCIDVYEPGNCLYFAGYFCSPSITIDNQSLALNGWDNMFLGEISAISNINNADMLSGIVIFPNPCIDVLNIISEKPVIRIEVIDMGGRVLIEESTLSEHFSIYLNDIKSGIYSLRINTASSVLYKRIVKL